MSPSCKWQFSLEHLLFAITILSTIIGAVIQPHLIEDGRYLITVNYSRTLEEMIAAGKFGWTDEDIDTVNSAIDPSKSGTEHLEAILVRLDRPVNRTATLLKVMDKNGWRPATLPELLALNEKYPDLQRLGCIYALGHYRQTSISRDIPCSFEDRGKGVLSLCLIDRNWTTYPHFLVFRKQ